MIKELEQELIQPVQSEFIGQAAPIPVVNPKLQILAS